MKLFKYHGVDKLPMLGNHEWRSPALVKPVEPFLNGAIFADFIGSYTNLPPGISAPISGSPYFVHPEKVAEVDFQMVGYRLGYLVSQTLQNPKIKRRNIARAMATHETNGSAFFAKGPVFDKDRNAIWPTFLFTVRDDQVVLEYTVNAH